MREIWKGIKGYEDKYQISNTGKVKSLKYNNTNKEILLSPSISKRGVYTINLWKNNKPKNFGVGQLVAMHFLKKNNENDVVVHIKDKLDDNVNNLKYVSLSEAQYNTKQNKKKQIDIIDEIYTTGKIKEQKKKAEENGIKAHQLYKRLYEGWSLEEAISIPIERQERILKKKLYKYKNKLYSVKQLSKISKIEGLNEDNLYKRLARGWSIEEAMEIPLAIKRGEMI